jgi:TonB family protein
MAPIAKEPEALMSLQSGTTAANPAGSKAQPAAEEIPVTVNGARSVEGSDRREPFSENTQTVLVFATGAVIRLASPVSPGQLLFLTNEKTKKEVVCQVVKSKSHSSTSGYVELEFTEASPDFWGVRFPLSGPAAAISNPAKQVAAIRAPEPKSLAERIASAQATPITAQTAGNRGAVDESSLSVRKIPTLSEFLTHGESGPEIKSSERTKSALAEKKPVENPQIPRQTANQLANTKATAEMPKSVREPQKKESLTNLLVPRPAAENPAPGASSFDFGADEVKIPAWLEPLARNSATVSATPETIALATREMDVTPFEAISHVAGPSTGSGCHSENDSHDDGSLSPRSAMQPSENQDAVFSPGTGGPSPNFGSSLAFDEKSRDLEGGAQGSGSGLKLGLLAATVVLVAGGGWYWYSNQIKDVSANGNVATTNQVVASASTAPSVVEKDKLVSPASNPSVEENRSPLNSQTLRSENKESLSPAAGSGKSAVSAIHLEQPAAATSRSLEEPAKKPSLGDVRLAAPKVNNHLSASESALSAPTLNSDSVLGADSAGAVLLSSNRKQPSAPAAPAPVGGDVQVARLLSSVAPRYPQMARSQRVSGDVKIDALVDAGGRVSTMKVISGPALLHQSAIDAVRQWKYAAATLNGKPVPMHLTVTVQFRLE